MSERGVFAVDRGIFDHPVFKAEPFTEREAWTWLISEAAFRAHTRRFGNFVVALERGQLSASLRFLASKWQWLPARVDRFLKRLKTEAMIETRIDTGVTVITICNYARYQRVSLPTDTDVTTANETPTRQRRDKVEDKENKEEEVRTLASLALPQADDWPSDFREQFWEAYPRRTEKQATIRKLETIRKSGKVRFVGLMAGVNRYREAMSGTDPKFIKQPPTWLNAGCWDDDPSALARAGPTVAAPLTPKQERQQGYTDVLNKLTAFNRAADADRRAAVEVLAPPGHRRPGDGDDEPDRASGGLFAINGGADTKRDQWPTGEVQVLSAHRRGERGS